jgi:hypothetical protein
LSLELLLGPSSGATPRDVAGALLVPFSIGVVVCWYRTSLSWMSSPLMVCSIVPTKVSVGGFLSRVIKSSDVALNRSRLLMRGKGLWGNHWS